MISARPGIIDPVAGNAKVWHRRGSAVLTAREAAEAPAKEGTLCVCGCPEIDHQARPVGATVGRICRLCRCPDFKPDPRTISLAQHLEACSLALQGTLDEVNTYKGMDRKIGMPVWSSGDDFRAHAEILEAFQTIENLRGRLESGVWIGRKLS